MLFQGLDDKDAEINGWTLLSRVFVGKGEFSQALGIFYFFILYCLFIVCLEEARDVSREGRKFGIMKRLNCLVGMINGQLQLGERMEELRQKVLVSSDQG